MNFGLGLGLPCTTVLRAIGGMRFLLDEVNGRIGPSYGFDPQSGSWTTYTALVRVDASPTTTEVYSAAELAALVLADPVTLVDMQDQGGSEHHLVQGTEADEPEIFLDANGYPFVDCQGGNFVRSATFMEEQSDVSMHVLWQTPSNPAGTPGLNTFHGNFDFEAASGGNILSYCWQKNQSPSLGTNGFSPFDWIDSKPRQHLFKWLDGTEHIFEGGINGNHTNTTTNPTFLRFTVGKNDFQDGNFRFYQATFWRDDVDAALVAEITRANFPAMFDVGQVQVNVGDSNSCSGFVNIGLQWTKKVQDSIEATGLVLGRTLGSRTIQHHLDNLDEIEAIFDNYTFTAATFVIHLGTNDVLVDLLSGAAALDLMEDLVTAIRGFATARGITLTIVNVTMLPRELLDEGERGDFNDGMIANVGGIYGDTIVNTTTNANLEDETNATYFVDTTHLSATGQTELATMIAAAL